MVINLLNDMCGLETLTGRFYARSDGMFIGQIDQPPEFLDNVGEVWELEVLVIKRKRYERPKQFTGKRADQMLMACVKLKDLVPISEEGE